MCTSQDHQLTAGVTFNYKKYGSQIRKLSAAAVSLSASAETQKATKNEKPISYIHVY